MAAAIMATANGWDWDLPMNRPMNRKQRRAAAKAGAKGPASPPPIAPAFADDFRQAQALHSSGRLGEAGSLYRRMLEADPGNPLALHFIGVIAYQGGNLAAAEDLIAQAVQRRPDYAEAHNNLGSSLLGQDKLAEAEASYRRAIALKPGLAEAHYNLGNALKKQDKIKDAIGCYRQAIAIDANYADPHMNLGIALQMEGELADAEAAFRRVIALKSDHRPNDNIRASHTAESEFLRMVHNDLGTVLRAQGKFEGAAAAYRKAIEIEPNNAESHYNLGNLFKGEDMNSEAMGYYEHAITLQPDFADALINLASVLKEQGDFTASVAMLRRTLEIEPDNAMAHSNLIFVLDFDPSQDQHSLQAERRRWAERHAHPLAARIKPHGNDPDPHRPLRIGYVSADFYDHSATRLFGPIVLGHDPEKFEITAYSGVEQEDKITERFRAGVGQWRDVAKLTDGELADQIRADGIDILVDLSGHSKGNRLLAFAEAPAPVQITAWGHGTGTGMATMDYLLSDPGLIPPGERGLFAEEVVDLPSNFLYEPPEGLPPVAALPAETSGHVTFGCLNRREKISPQSIELWSEILDSVPNSRLLIKAQELSDDMVRARLADEFAADGVGEDRLVLLGRTGQLEHMAAHNRIDIALDPFPYSGGVSTADALWMGVPVVTLRGRTISARNAASILTAAGLDEFIAESPDGYRDIAIAAAGDIEKLSLIRSGLRERAQRSPLGDAAAYVRSVEAAYRHMWRRKCAGQVEAVAQ